MIAYHGTNRRAAKSILLTGFRKGTWFAYQKSNAVFFGGPHVFAVEFSDDPKFWHGSDDGERWQFWIREALPKKVIVSYEVRARGVLFRGLVWLRSRFTNSNAPCPSIPTDALKGRK